MDKITTTQELARIETALAQFSEGASIENIKNALNPPIGKRTLQRRLVKLQEIGVVSISGRNKATRYHLIRAKEEKIENISKEHSIPLSPEAEEIIKIITQPENMREPVAYNIDFLMSYRPNVDSYLSDAEKNKLAELGKTTGLDQPAGTYAKNILQRLLIDLAWNSSRLEGNTYSLLETQRLLALGKAAEDKTAEEAQMILNHKEAIEFIVRFADEVHFSHYFVSGLHALLSNNLMADPDASGRLRTIGVGIGRSVYMPLEIPQQIEEMFGIILHKADQIENPFEQSFFVSVHLPYLQPFEDVNKRVSRLAANIPLIKHNLSPLSFVGVPKGVYIYGLLGIYEFNRIEVLKDVFMWAYARSAARYAALRQTVGKPDPFVSKYRQEIRSLVSEIVLNALPYEEAIQKIKQAAEQLPEEDRVRFTEIIDTDLMNLKENNIARYFIRPSEFRVWKEKWEL
ncbi:Fic family protein [Asinibacterium sp. OR53]|uniref:Fic family protein n=1 Tax=Asinibacterium sp. OR53 TaxID=925409 RepID=UPI00047CBCFE|nr:Fic family protein [Asinibacterium sp. OR53]